MANIVGLYELNHVKRTSIADIRDDIAFPQAQKNASGFL